MNRPLANPWLAQASDQNTMMMANPRRVPKKSSNFPPTRYIAPYAAKNAVFKRAKDCVSKAMALGIWSITDGSVSRSR